MIIFSDCIPEDDRTKLEALGHVIVNVHPSNVCAMFLPSDNLPPEAPV